MIEYKIVKVVGAGNLINKLEKEVNDLIEQGWELQGGVSIYPLNYSNGNRFFALLQTMTKEKHKEINNE